MGSKLGLILSISIIFFAFLFGADLIMIQLQYTELDSLSAIISYKISKEAEISESLLMMCEERNINIVALNPEVSGYQKGDVFSYTLSREYTPLVLGNQPFDITITRHAVISILN